MLSALFFYQIVNTRLKYVIFKTLHKAILAEFCIGFVYMFVIEYNINSPIFYNLI